MIPQPRHQFLFLCLLQYLRLSLSRDWMDAIDAKLLLNDGMPRVSPPRNKTRDYAAFAKSNTNALSHMMAKHIDIEIHGSSTTIFEEIDPFRITSEPSSAPSYSPSSVPSGEPSTNPTSHPSISPTESIEPTSTPTAKPTPMPTSAPTFSIADVPSNPKPGYFNYDPTSPYGPNRWKNIDKIDKNDPGYFWHTFDLDDDEVSNDCDSGKKQSPIDVCRKPKDSCTETHEMRPKSGDYKMDSDLIHKQILSNKLRLILEPRTGEEPDPPQIDFSSNGRGITDMTNIDFKFPSEHTVCGQRFDGEMQYFTYHPARKRFVAVIFFLDAAEGNPRNEHLQEVLEEFKLLHKEDEKKCRARHSSTSAQTFASSFASGGGNNRQLYSETSIDEQTRWNSTILESEEQRTGGGLRSNRRLALKWHPFHPDIQKSVHFWGYSGSFTEPPCTKDSVDWKIMDVPTPISQHQLAQFRHILFTHVDEDCQRTSVHNAEGSVARPTQESLKYYKCTRDEYVSDEERAVCGDDGCVKPFGAGLNPYFPPLVDVTGPPTRSPSR